MTMLRSLAFIRETGILSPRNVTFGQFPRKLRAARVFLSGDCKEPFQCPEPCDGPCLMDQMPVPKCSWQAKYDKEMKESNQVLMMGGGFFIATILAMRQIGYVRGYDVPLF